MASRPVGATEAVPVAVTELTPPVPLSPVGETVASAAIVTAPTPPVASSPVGGTFAAPVTVGLPISPVPDTLVGFQEELAAFHASTSPSSNDAVFTSVKSPILVAPPPPPLPGHVKGANDCELLNPE